MYSEVLIELIANIVYWGVILFSLAKGTDVSGRTCSLVYLELTGTRLVLSTALH
jgi:hypothetical protein